MSKSVVLIQDGLDCFAEEFDNIDLSTQTIKNAEFEECTFTSCDFSEALFLSCRFIDCSFENCNLSVMKLTDSIVSGTDFLSCKMIGIDWTMCDFKSLLSSEPIKFVNSLLSDSNLFGLSLERIQMRECVARDVDFGSGSFMSADFSATDFKGAQFGNTHLEYANFTDATNIQLDIKTNHLKGAIFSRYEALFLLESMGIVLVD